MDSKALADSGKRLALERGSKARSGPTQVVCYDPIELAALTEALTITGQTELPGSIFPVVHGTLDGFPVSVLRIPFGDKPALLRSVIGAMARAVRPSQVVSIGTCMALGKELAVGDAVLNISAFHEGLTVGLGTGLAREFSASAPHAMHLRTVTSLTTSVFVEGDECPVRAAAVRQGADVIEMEDHHLALMAGEMGFGITSLRVVTDHGDMALHLANLASAAKRSVWLLRRGLRQARMNRFLTDVDNPPTADLPYRMAVRHHASRLTIPEAVRLARSAVASFGFKGMVPAGARVDLEVVGALDLASAPESLSGRARVVGAAGAFSLSVDEEGSYAKLAVVDGAATPAVAELRAAVKGTPPAPVPVARPAARSVTLPSCEALHVQGLNSISAEPEEGLLAATTIEELAQGGHRVVRSDQAPVWVYRSAHAAQDSYFEPDYVVPMRAAGPPAEGTFLIATGLGPAIDPAAPGGASADLLMLGDEQCGRLSQLLDDLSCAPFGADDVFRYEGVAARLADGVALSRIDRRRLLTTEGLNTLSYEPATLRQVYSEEYDAFLGTYFAVQRRPHAAVGSHLVLSSRGCGYNCSFCCSGGLQPFSALSPEVFVDLLRKVKERHGLEPGQYLDVYVLDSYFNRNPDRIVKIADQLEKTGLRAYFELYVRHNGLQAFLKKRAEGSQTPVVNEQLIEAYRRLGIDEIVMGVDAYTERSIRMLKTNVVQLARSGDQARPLYSFADIQAVTTAIERAGLSSRGFLLAYNPFVTDVDRLETFYNLGMLALTTPGFAIDAGSSSRVNELKPFPGAPMTRAAELIPGLIQGDRFAYDAPLGRLEDLMDFEMFGGRRRDAASTAAFVTRFQEARKRLAVHLLGQLDSALLHAAVPALAELARLEECTAALVTHAPHDAQAEAELSRLATHARADATRLAAAAAAQAPAEDPEALFYRVLATA